MSTDTHSLPDSSPNDVLNRVGEAVCALDDEWRFTFVNDQVASMLERTPEELLGEDLWETVPEIDDGLVGEKLRRAMETQEAIRFESYDDSSGRWFKVRLYPSEDGITACFYEITDERGEQLDLQRKRRLFETVFEETEDALVVADTDRRITDFNSAAERLFGYDASEIVGKKARVLYADLEDYEQQGRQRFNEDVPEREETYIVEYERADGTTFEGETLGTSLKGPDGGTLAFLGSIRDISARVEYEQEIKARNDALRTFHEVSTDEGRSFDDQLETLLELGTDHLGLDIGFFSRIDDGECVVEHTNVQDNTLQSGDRFDCQGTYCSLVGKSGELVTIENSGESEYEHPADPKMELESYIGVPVVVDGEQYGTVHFSGTNPRQEPFAEGKQNFVRVLAQWLGKELSRQQNRERATANRKRLRQIIDMLPQLVFAKDRNGEFLLANQAIAEAYGTTVEELEGATDADFAESKAEARQFRKDDLAVIDSGEPKRIPEESLTTADGEEMICQTTKIPYDPVDHDQKAVLGVATDITTRKEREREREIQAAAMEAAMDGIAILDDGKYIYMNQAHADVFDFETEELLGSGWREVYGEAEIDRLESEVFPAIERDGEWRGETVGEKRDGSPVNQEITLSLLDDGKLICTNRDVTRRKERERKLKRQRTRLRALFDESPDGIIIHDTDGNVLDANETELEMLGFDRETLLSMNVADFEVGVSQSELKEKWADMSVGDVWKVEGEHRRKNGETFLVEVWVNKVEVEEKERYIAVDRDITDRKARENELRQTKERLNLAVEGANLGVWDWDMETDAVTFNEQWAEMLGFSLEEIEPNLDQWEQRVHPADMADVEEQLEAHIAGDAELYDCEHRMQTKSGDWKWIRDVGKVVERDEAGDPTRAVGIHLDITDEKRSKLHLEEERDMFAEGPAVVFKWRNDDGWPVEYVSENVTETFGYTPEQLTSGTVPYAELIHEDDIERIESEVESKSDETTQRFSHEPYRMVTASGEIRWVTDNTKIIRTEGEITHYLGYLIDITEQKRLEQSLRESERSLRELTEIASDVEQSFEEKLSSLLELGTERLGLSYGFLNRIDQETQHVVEAVGDHPELQSGNWVPKAESYCRKTMTEERVLSIQDAVAEGWKNDPAYERFELGCYIGGTITVDGDEYGTLCFADRAPRERTFDDTEQAFVELLVQWISYELASQAFESKLQEINDTAQQLITAHTRETIARLTMESARSILEMPVNGIWWWDESAETLVPETMTEEAHAVFPEQPTLEADHSLAYDAFEADEVRAYDRLADVDGLYNEDTVLESEALVPFGDHGLMSVGSTETQTFSQADLNLLEVLSATVEAALSRAEREQELRETQQELKQSNEELEQFAYAASHDLQEPLRTVSSYLTLLKRRYGEDLDSDAIDFIDFAVDGADRMRDMIQALLAYSRVDTRGQDFEPIDVSTIFERVRQNLKMTIEETDATVSTPATELTVLGDESQLVQLFQNLVENGIKYNSDPREIDISVTCQDERVTIAVTDNGIGMHPDQTDDIFEVFNRLHTREEFDGTGVGLSICRKIAERHDGEINVESEPDDGSTFTVVLPLGDDHNA
jgi:PAS domain S-box-containing protein